MNSNRIVHRSILIKATPSKVWEALTDPSIVRQYLFGTNMTADWKVGGRISYKGVWEGKEYEDGGTILELVPKKILKSTYWSSMSGTEDKPENYATVTYLLEEMDGGTRLTLTQDNNKSEAAREHSEQNWGHVLEAMKRILEC
ncbi:MAG: SRPBCC family protein [Bacteroidota bacterium]|nr:SRPBCC family protein [Bacteroidota bacterium]MDP4230134.1 SRPBCC family protein [Bacteroidota bacterium]